MFTVKGDELIVANCINGTFINDDTSLLASLIAVHIVVYIDGQSLVTWLM